MLQVNQVVYDQVDIFQSDFFSRVPGLTITDVTLSLTLNNVAVAWPLVNGSSVIDSQVVAGSVYWSELATHAYGVRFFPNALGHWNLSISYPLAPAQIIILDYDLVNLPISVESGLRADFCS